MATLVHDDVLDATPLRRGRPTVWHSDGRERATATGDYLFARAFAELAATGDIEAVTILSDACLALARGEILQRAQTGRSVHLRRCLSRALHAQDGGGCSRPRRCWVRDSVDSTARRATRWAASPRRSASHSRSLTTCSIVTGNPDTTGKPLGTDLLDGTVTLPLILAAERDGEVREVIASGAKPDDVLPTLARVVASGAITDAQAEARRLSALALAELDGVTAPVDHDALREAVRMAVERSS